MLLKPGTLAKLRSDIHMINMFNLGELTSYKCFVHLCQLHEGEPFLILGYETVQTFFGAVMLCKILYKDMVGYIEMMPIQHA